MMDSMGVFESIVLGFVQGLTEFVPVSSSGHLVLAQKLFNSGPSDQLFVESLDIGTTAALIIYFWPRLLQLGHRVYIEHDYRLLRNIIITSIPAGGIGFLLAGFIEKNTILVQPLVVAIMLGVVGVLMIIVDRLPHLSAKRDGESLSSGRALIIGGAQALALVPGVSRSGSTIVASRFMGLSFEKAAEYSFMVSIPIMLGLIAKLFFKESDRLYIIAHLEPVVIGNVAAFISGIFAISFLLHYLSRHGLAIFGWYRVTLSLIILIILLLQ